MTSSEYPGDLYNLIRTRFLIRQRTSGLFVLLVGLLFVAAYRTECTIYLMKHFYYVPGIVLTIVGLAYVRHKSVFVIIMIAVWLLCLLCVPTIRSNPPIPANSTISGFLEFHFLMSVPITFGIFSGRAVAVACANRFKPPWG